MHPIYDTFLPDGFSTINAYLFVENPESLIEFLKNAFYAEELNRTLRQENNTIANCILKIGKSCFMISQASGPFLNMKTALYLIVEDVDGLHQRALDFGAQEVFAPADMEYQDRQSGIIDPSGNYWWITKRLVNKGYEALG